jgi:glycosyltransferase involved in cell wall biosynthesis
MSLSKTILVVCPDFPYPATNGTRVDIWNRILFFRRLGWRIILVVCWTKELSGKAGNFGADLPIALEYYVFHQDSSQNSSQVQELIDRYRPAVVWCDYAIFAPLASALTLNGAKLWFRPINFELAHEWEKEIERQPWFSWRSVDVPAKSLAWLWRLRGGLSYLFKIERQMHKISDRIFYISRSDSNAMSWLYRGNAKKAWVLPFLARESISAKANKTPLDVVYFSSNYTSPLHLSGALKLLNEVIPVVQKQIPGAFRFHIVGKGSHEVLGKYTSEIITIHDFVDDLSAFLQEMDVACVPIPIGWGCKLKMVEALASGLPVVGAPETFRSVPLIPEAYYLCRTAQDYVEAFRSLQEFSVRQSVGETARKTYETWRLEGEQVLQQALEEVDPLVG